MNDESCMRRAIELAREGQGLTSPGAMVGCVIVNKSEVVGEGVYTWDGVKHAEVLALEQAGEAARGATVYLNLEPCAHQGRTPPCVDALVAAGVARVVAAIEDPFPEVNGRGLEALRQADIEVECGLLGLEASRLNEVFIHRTSHDRPYGLLKVGMSLDGKIATASGESRWITSEDSRRIVHRLRHASDALLTGSGTILQDDPRLTDRSGLPRRRPLQRVVLDRRGRLHSGLKVFDDAGVLVYTQVPHLDLPPPHEAAVDITKLPDVARDLARRGFGSFMLECGPDLAFDALRHGIIDKLVVFLAPRIIGGREFPGVGGQGVAVLSDSVEISDWEVQEVGPDLMVTGYVHRDN